MLPAPFASKCIPNSSFSCLHGGDGAGRLGRPGRLPVGLRGLMHVGKSEQMPRARLDFQCELRLRTRTMDAPNVNTKMAALLAIAVSGRRWVSNARRVRKRSNKMPCCCASNRWLTSGIGRWINRRNASGTHFRVFVAAAASPKPTDSSDCRVAHPTFIYPRCALDCWCWEAHMVFL
jgi:hypothetical protein